MFDSRANYLRSGDSTRPDFALVALDALLTILAVGFAALIVASARPIDAGQLNQDPLDLPALRRLALEDERQGRTVEAERLLEFVGGRSWRDGPTEAWLVRRRLQEGRYDDAFRSADSLLRRDDDGATRPVLYAMFTAAAAYPDARPALEARLMTSPDWRGDVLIDIGLHGDPAGAGEVFADLAKGLSPPAPSEYAPYVERLVATGDYPAAKAAWERIARQGVASDEFSAPSDQTAFTWSTSSGEGWASEIGPSPDPPNRRALRVDYDGFSVARLPERLLVLSPGRYRLTWRESADRRWRARLSWRLRCADTDQTLQSEAPASTSPSDPSTGIDRTMDFAVPASGCRGQWLQLTATPADRRDPVTAWFEGFQVRALSDR
jgi:hypothetical protein